MNRREFIKFFSLGALFAAIVPFTRAAFQKDKLTKPASPNDLYYPLRGNAFDTCTDGNSHYNHISFEQMADDIERFRMPWKWTEATLLELHQPDLIS